MPWTLVASLWSSHLCSPALVTHSCVHRSQILSETQPDQVSENATFRRHSTMAVIHLAKTSSVLDVLSALCRLADRVQEHIGMGSFLDAASRLTG
jgi:hypothetical protein